MFSNKKTWKIFSLIGLLSVLTTWTQPVPAPTTGDAPCSPEPTGAALNDTVVSSPDDSGYLSLFDGTLKGWWNSCLTTHSGGSSVGAAFRIGSDAGKPALYSGQHSTDGSVSGARDGIGGVLMTRKKFINYEIVFDFWPDFGNDGGLFNRTDGKGKCFQTVLDYLGAGSVGGTWGEGGFTGRNEKPFKFLDESSIEITSGPNGWSSMTAANNPASYGCAIGGCLQPDYLRLWDINGWNQMKIQFFGGSGAGTGAIHMSSWFRKAGATVWVPIIKDSLNVMALAGYIGLQVHGGQRFEGKKGSWYKNIKWRPLDDMGKVIKLTTATLKPARSYFNLSATPTALVGSIDRNFELVIQDLNGKTLESFSGSAGKISHVFKTSAHGWLSIQIKSANTVETLRILRD